MNLALRGGRGPFVLEKWYLDVLLPDASVLMLYLGWMRLLGLPLARFTAELFRPGMEPIRGSARVTRCRGGEDRLVFGPAVIEGRAVRWSTPGLTGELRFTPRYPAVVLRDPFISDGERRLLWNVEVPDAVVEGDLRWPGGGRAIAGRGYRDRVWFDLAPWHFPIRELRWGRAAAGGHAATWVVAHTRSGRLRAGWTDGNVVPDPKTPALEDEQTLLTTHVADIEALRFGALRPLLRRVTGDPHEIKWAASATIEGVPGRAIHERVRWH